MKETIENEVEEIKESASIFQFMPASSEASKKRSSVISRLSAIKERDYDKNDYHEMLKLYDKTVATVKENETCQGIVVGIDPDFVLVDVGFKSPGAIPLGEFNNVPNLQIGDSVEVFVEKKWKIKKVALCFLINAQNLCVFGNVLSNHRKREKLFVESYRVELKVDLSLIY